MTRPRKTCDTCGRPLAPILWESNQGRCADCTEAAFPPAPRSWYATVAFPLTGHKRGPEPVAEPLCEPPDSDSLTLTLWSTIRTDRRNPMRTRRRPDEPIYATRAAALEAAREIVKRIRAK